MNNYDINQRMDAVRSAFELYYGDRINHEPNPWKGAKPARKMLEKSLSGLSPQTLSDYLMPEQVEAVKELRARKLGLFQGLFKRAPREEDSGRCAEGTFGLVELRAKAQAEPSASRRKPLPPMSIAGKAGTVQDLTNRPIWVEIRGRKQGFGSGPQGMRAAAIYAEEYSRLSPKIECGGVIIGVEQAWKWSKG